MNRLSFIIILSFILLMAAAMAFQSGAATLYGPPSFGKYSTAGQTIFALRPNSTLSPDVVTSGQLANYTTADRAVLRRQAMFSGISTVRVNASGPITTNSSISAYSGSITDFFTVGSSLYAGSFVAKSLLTGLNFYPQYLTDTTTDTGTQPSFSIAQYPGKTNRKTGGSQYFVNISPVYNQASGTASNTDLRINRTETAIGSGTQRLFSAGTGGGTYVEKFGIDNTGNIATGVTTPSITTAAGDAKLLIGSTSAYDNGNHRLGIGTVSPRGTMDAYSSATGKGRITVGSNTNYGVFDQALGLRYSGDTTTWDDMLVELVSENTDVFPSAGVLGSGADTATGTYQSLYKRNGVLWTISESTSAGRMVELTFEDVDQLPALFFTGRYVGSTAHAANVTWVAYNYATTAWDNLNFAATGLAPWTNATQYNDEIITGFTAQHISPTGQVRVAVNHGSGGTTTHVLTLDEVRLIQDNQPTSQYYKGGRVQSYRNTGYDIGHYKGQATHAYKTGSDWKWHVHFTTESVIPNRATIKFRNTHTTAGLFKNFSAAIIDATFTNNSATRLLYNIPHTAGNIAANVHLLVGGDTDVKGTNFTISTIVAGEIKRLAGTYVDPVLVLYTDFHLEIDSTGSNDVYIKNNTP